MEQRLQGMLQSLDQHQHALECDSCKRWTHQLCGTGISYTQYRRIMENLHHSRRHVSMDLPAVDDRSSEQRGSACPAPLQPQLDKSAVSDDDDDDDDDPSVPPQLDESSMLSDLEAGDVSVRELQYEIVGASVKFYLYLTALIHLIKPGLIR